MDGGNGADAEAVQTGYQCTEGKGLIEVKIKRYDGAGYQSFAIDRVKGTSHREPGQAGQKHQPLGPKGTILLTDITIQRLKKQIELALKTTQERDEDRKKTTGRTEIERRREVER